MTGILPEPLTLTIKDGPTLAMLYHILNDAGGLLEGRYVGAHADFSEVKAVCATSSFQNQDYWSQVAASMEANKVDYKTGKVEPKPKEIKLNSEYSALVSAKGIKVGCQTFPLEVAQQLADAVKEITTKS